MFVSLKHQGYISTTVCSCQQPTLKIRFSNSCLNNRIQGYHYDFNEMSCFWLLLAQANRQKREKAAELNSADLPWLHVASSWNALMQEDCVLRSSLQFQRDWLRLLLQCHHGNRAVSGKRQGDTGRGSNKKERRPNPPAYLGLGALKRPVKKVALGIFWLRCFSEHFAVFDRVMSSHSLCILLISLVMNSDVSAVWIN